MTVPELRTERLLLRAWRDEDLDAWAAIAADADTMRWVGSPHGMSREAAWRHIAYMAGHWTLKGFGQWAVEDAGGGLIGHVGLNEPEGWPGLELGWLVARPHWGNGFAPEAARASMDWAREELGASHLISLIADDNERSARVAEKLGMKLEDRAVIRDRHDESHDLRVFGRDL